MLIQVNAASPTRIDGRLRPSPVPRYRSPKRLTKAGIEDTEVTYHRWRRESGGLKGDQGRRLKELAEENARLRRAVSDPTLDKLILTEAATGNF
jgi:hypothetical protein